MLRFAANLSMMFTELPFLDRFAAAAAADFRAVEFQFPYAYAAADIRTALDTHGLELVVFNIAPGDWSAGDRGLAAVASRQAEFATALAEALQYCDALGCRQLHAMAGLIPQGADERIYRANLGMAARAAAERGVTVLIEPINTVDVPGYHLTQTATALETIAAVDHPALKLQFDAYHCAMMGGDVVADFAAATEHIHHVQIAGCPGRAEPDTGDLAYAALFSAIDASDFDGWVGCEYQPKADTAAGLGWRAEYATERSS